MRIFEFFCHLFKILIISKKARSKTLFFSRKTGKYLIKSNLMILHKK